MSNDVREPATISWRFLALGACSLVLTTGGLAIGLWSQSLDQRLDDIARGQRKQWEVLAERANLAPRLDATERQTSDQEQRLRSVEQQLWKARR